MHLLQTNTFSLLPFGAAMEFSSSARYLVVLRRPKIKGGSTWYLVNRLGRSPHVSQSYPPCLFPYDRLIRSIQTAERNSLAFSYRCFEWIIVGGDRLTVFARFPFLATKCFLRACPTFLIFLLSVFGLYGCFLALFLCVQTMLLTSVRFTCHRSLLSLLFNLLRALRCSS